MLINERGNEQYWPTCSQCGCRLRISAGSDDAILSHFSGNTNNTDARGCRCSLIDDFAFVTRSRVEKFIDA